MDWKQMRPWKWVVLTISLALLGTRFATAAQSDRPNVIIILADDLGYGDLGSYGSTLFKTPNLDRMAQEGVRFANFLTPMPFCAPTRAALLTGRYPFRSGMVFNPAPDSGVKDVGLPAEEFTLGEAFQEAGYATLCVGKWHLGHQPHFYPTRHGFDEYLGILYSNDMRPVQLIENEKVIEYPVIQATLTKRYTQRALQFIEQHRSQPFFLYLAHAMPHKPLAASEDFYMTSPAGLYGDVIAELDWSVGQVLSKVRELGLERNTLVIFTSDNGPWYGGSTGGLRGMKGSPWEGGIRVPMIARWPGRIPAGRTCNEIAGMIDLFPTVLGISGIELPEDLAVDGKNIWPLISTEDAKTPHEALLVMHGPNLSAIRSGKWKLHVLSPGGIPDRGSDWVDPRAPDGVTIIAPYEQARPAEYPGVISGDEPRSMMLFDLESDPAEQNNVADQHPETVKQLRELFDQINAQVPEFRRPERTPLQKPGPRPEEAQASRPNIVIILADDLGYGDLGVTGAPDIRTPNIDRLAREGVRFAHAYANAPVCSPTRAALLTGRYQQRAGIDRVLYAHERDRGMTLDAVLLPEVLKKQGYRTAIIGKWHLGYPKKYFPTRQGFDEFFGFVSGNIDYFSHTDRLENHDLWRNETEVHREGEYFTQLIADEAIQFLDRNRDNPFFLYLPFNAPHDPFQSPDDMETAGDQHITRQVNRTRAVYREMVEALDHHIGRVLNHLERLGLDQQTAVFFMSDNGGVRDVARNAPFRNAKGSLWEGGIRTALIGRWKGQFPAGRVVQDIAIGMDLCPTALEIAGVDPAQLDLDAVSLVDVLRGKGRLQRDAVYFHYQAPRRPAQYALVEGGWKYLRDNQPKEHLFHLAADPYEQKDLATAHPKRLAGMKERYETWRSLLLPD